MTTDRTKALDTALSQIEKAFGKGSIWKLGQRPNIEIEAISTGSIGLDLALGIGGLPKGRVIEIFGPESSGKTTLTLQVIAECQKKGGTCAFVDAEQACGLSVGGLHPRTLPAGERTFCDRQNGRPRSVCASQPAGGRHMRCHGQGAAWPAHGLCNRL
jgi:hypothetical protein